MLRILREHATSWMLRGILILVAVTFITWGGYSLIREKTVTYAANVNGTAIDMRDYLDAYQNIVKQYRDALGAAFSDKMLDGLHLKEKVLDDLITRVLIVQEGARLKLGVSNEELRDAIESIPALQVDGRFDPQIYERFLRFNRLSAEEFERMQRDRILLSKVVNLVRQNGGKVSEEEVLDLYLFDNEKINLNFVKVSPDSFRGQVNANEVEIKDYYQKHQEEFRLPTSIKIQYLAFRPSDFDARVQVTPEEVTRYYDLQKERFKTPKQVKAREIVIKAGPQDPPDKVAEKQKKAEEILDKARKTKDFASLAKQYSESDTAKKGGDVGWVQKGMFDEPIDSTLLSMKPGEISSVLRGAAGFSIFKVEEAKEEKQRSIEEAREQIVQTLKKEKATAEASRKADDAFYSLFRTRDLEKYAQEKDLPIKTTGFFKEGDEVPELGRDPAFFSSAFSLKMGEISPVVNIAPNFYILKLVDKKESRIPSLEEVKEGVTQKVIQGKSEAKARQVAEDLLNQVRTGKEIKELARERGFRAEETGFFSRTAGVIPKIGPAGESVGMLSSLTEKNPLPKEVLTTKDGYFVIRLAGMEPADQAKFPSVKEGLQRRLTYQKQEEFFQNWLQQLKKKAKIDINQEAVKG
jgi:peptidyl-prolyl cis-trans isomerase D